MKRSLVTLAGRAAAVAGVLIGVLATRSSAQYAHSPRTITSTLVGSAVSSNPDHPSRHQIRLPATVTGDDGSTGTGDALCTLLITEQARFCDVRFTLSTGLGDRLQGRHHRRRATGLLSLQGIAYEPNVDEPLIVTGGTGAYVVARIRQGQRCERDHRAVHYQDPRLAGGQVVQIGTVAAATSVRVRVAHLRWECARDRPICGRNAHLSTANDHEQIGGSRARHGVFIVALCDQAGPTLGGAVLA
jgi:hypothetical protein